MKEKNKAFYVRLGIALLLVTILINVAVFNYLPQNIGLQMHLNGGLGNYVSKLTFMFLAPLVLLITTVCFSVLNKEATSKCLIIAIVIFIANILVIFTNMKI